MNHTRTFVPLFSLGEEVIASFLSFFNWERERMTYWNNSKDIYEVVNSSEDSPIEKIKIRKVELSQLNSLGFLSEVWPELPLFYSLEIFKNEKKYTIFFYVIEEAVVFLIRDFFCKGLDCFIRNYVFLIEEPDYRKLLLKEMKQIEECFLLLPCLLLNSILLREVVFNETLNIYKRKYFSSFEEKENEVERDDIKKIFKLI